MAPHQDVTVKLTGTDGNGAAIIGRVSATLRREKGAEVANEWAEYAMDSSSYDQLLQRAMEIVNVV